MSCTHLHQYLESPSTESLWAHLYRISLNSFASISKAESPTSIGKGWDHGFHWLLNITQITFLILSVTHPDPNLPPLPVTCGVSSSWDIRRFGEVWFSAFPITGLGFSIFTSAKWVSLIHLTYSFQNSSCYAPLSCSPHLCTFLFTKGWAKLDIFPIIFSQICSGFQASSTRPEAVTCFCTPIIHTHLDKSSL